VRGYVIARQASFLVPYQAGLAAEARDYHTLDALLRGSVAALAGDATVVRARAMQWRRVYAAPVLSGTRSTPGLDAEGKSRFDAIRRSLTRLQDAPAARGSQARA
jgi:hypothetical protein